jgi:predicted nucleotidyltransferase component of viral defense system
MTFHQSPEFEPAIRAAAAHFNQRDIFIEKDYWVTFILKALSQSEFRDKIVFKGGTSLSKAFNCIDRFSEDIDLAVLNADGITGNQLSELIKQVESKLARFH